MRAPESVANAVTLDPMFGHKDDGTPIVRERLCECGRRFPQRQLSERFMAATEAYSKRAAANVLAQCPDLFVPVHCPSCERRDLGRQARMDDTRTIPDRRDDAAD